ncbi:hypothetical protein [Streptomyces sp. NPDC053367]|uniref:hypothetical protein n=1 Tax=Streptomyces sp. NPDC053367 TaxID=3365700 RepID=UPI0037D4B0C3
MSGGQRYWNEDTQRWEDQASGPAPAPSAPPRSDAAPGAEDLAWWDEDAGTFAGAGPGAGRERPAALTPPARPTAPAPGSAPSAPDPAPSGSGSMPSGSGSVPSVPGPATPPPSGSVLPASGSVPSVPGSVTPPPSGSVPSVPGSVTPPPSGSVPSVPGSATPPPSGSVLPASGQTPPPSGSVLSTSGQAPSASGPLPSASGPLPSAPGSVLPTTGQAPSASPGPMSPSSGSLPPGVLPAQQWPGGQPVVTGGDAGPPRPAVDRRVVWSVVVGAAVVGVAVSLLLTFVAGKDDGDGTDARPPATSGSPRVESPSPTDPTPTEEESVPPSPTLAAPPAGYALTEDEEGFRTAVPEGWSRSEVDSQFGISVVNYRSPDGTQRIQVYQVAEASPDESFALYLSEDTPRPDGFVQLSLENLDDGDFTGSRLEYLAGSIKGEPDVGTWHVYDERFVASDGQIYAVASYGPDSDGGGDELELLNTALGWFCPPYGTCAGPEPDLS